MAVILTYIKHFIFSSSFMNLHEISTHEIVGGASWRGTMKICNTLIDCYAFSSLPLLSLTVNCGYSHCNLISEKNDMTDMEMANSLGTVCRQNLLIHSGNSLTRDHPLTRERCLHVSQLNLSRPDTRYCFQLCLLCPFISKVVTALKTFIF